MNDPGLTHDAGSGGDGLTTRGNSFLIQSKIVILKEVLTANFEFRYNIISGKIEFREISPLPSTPPGKWAIMGDRDFNQIWSFLCSHFFARLDEGSLRRVIESYFAPAYNPIDEFLTSLPTWDGTADYIKTLAELVTVKPGQESTWYLYLVRWLIATVATMTGAGINHTCLILLGPQGCGKSTFFHSLGISEELTYTGYIVPGDRDSKILAAEKTIINLDELESSTREDWSFIKSLITLPHISVRRPYGRRTEELPRRASFCGSANDIQILGDLTGSRRWLCVECEAVNYLGVTDDLKRLVYSQARAMLEAGEKYWFDGDEIKDVDDHNKKYKQAAVEEEGIKKLYEPVDPSSTEAILLTTSEIMKELNAENNAVRYSIKKIGQALQAAGFQKAVRKGDRLYAYCLKRKIA